MFSPQQEPTFAPEHCSLLQLQDQLLGKHFDPNCHGAGASGKIVDSLLAKEFSNLSVQERSKTYEELHGVNEPVTETSTFIGNSLWQLDVEISKIKRKYAYELAEQQNKDYVMDVEFRTRFLRAESFHPGKAAIRLVEYFEGMLKYFGENLLTKRIQYSDLDRDDQACVKAGHLQILPFRDQSGRVVFTDMDPFQDKSYVAAINRLRAFIYMWLMMAEDDENQKRGLEVYFELPFREFLQIVERDVASMMERTLKYSLLGFGIPVDRIPFSRNEGVKMTNVNRWIAKNIARDKELAYGGTFSGVDLPSRNDVLMVKGKPYQRHPGNVYLRELVEAYMDKYLTTRKPLHKMDIAYKVCSMIRARSGRFLVKDDDGWWRESHNAVVMDKVRKRLQRKNMKQEPQASDDAHTQQFDGGDSASKFPQQGKRPKYDADCRGT